MKIHNAAYGSTHELTKLTLNAVSNGGKITFEGYGAGARINHNLTGAHVDFGISGSNITQFYQAVVFDSLVSIGSGYNGAARLHVSTGSAALKGLVLEGAASQSQPLLEARDSSGNVITSIPATGGLVFPKTKTIIWGDSNDELRLDDSPSWYPDRPNVFTFKSYQGAFVWRESSTSKNVAVLDYTTKTFKIGELSLQGNDDETTASGVIRFPSRNLGISYNDVLVGSNQTGGLNLQGLNQIRFLIDNTNIALVTSSGINLENGKTFSVANGWSLGSHATIAAPKFSTQVFADGAFRSEAGFNPDIHSNGFALTNQGLGIIGIGARIHIATGPTGEIFRFTAGSVQSYSELLLLDTPGPAITPLNIRGAATQNAPLTTWKNISNNVLLAIDAQGRFSTDVRLTTGSKLIFETNGNGNVLYRDSANGNTILGSASGLIKFTNGDTSTLANIQLAGIQFGTGLVTGVGTTAGTLAAGDDSRLTGSLQQGSTLTGSGNTSSPKDMLSGTMEGNDFFRLRIGASGGDQGWVELATADNGDEPIYVRQYTGGFSNIARTLTLLDGNGNTSVPGQLNVAGRIFANDQIYLTDSVNNGGAFVRIAAPITGVVLNYIEIDQPNSRIKIQKENPADAYSELTDNSLTIQGTKVLDFRRQDAQGNSYNRIQIEGNTGIQGGINHAMQLYGWHGIFIEGQRRQGAPAYRVGNTTQASLTVLGTHPDAVVSRIVMASAQTADVFEIRNSTGNITHSFSANGDAFVSGKFVANGDIQTNSNTIQFGGNVLQQQSGTTNNVVLASGYASSRITLGAHSAGYTTTSSVWIDGVSKLFNLVNAGLSVNGTTVIDDNRNITAPAITAQNYFQAGSSYMDSNGIGFHGEESLGHTIRWLYSGVADVILSRRSAGVIGSDSSIDIVKDNGTAQINFTNTQFSGQLGTVTIGNFNGDALIRATRTTAGIGDILFATGLKSGSIKARVKNNGQFVIGANADVANAMLYVQNDEASQPGLRVDMAAGQTANATEVRDSSGNVKFNVGADGSIKGKVSLTLQKTDSFDGSNFINLKSFAGIDRFSIYYDGSFYSQQATISTLLTVLPDVSNPGETIVFRIGNGITPLASITKNGNLQIATINGSSMDTYSAILRGDHYISGGGIISATETGVGWTNRFIIISAGNGNHFSSTGYFDISMPTNGTVIPGFGGAASATVSGGIVPLTSWQALYYNLPIGNNNTNINGNYFIASYNGSFVLPTNAVRVVFRNGDENKYYFPRGINLFAGETYNVSSSSTVNGPIPAHTHASIVNGNTNVTVIGGGINLNGKTTIVDSSNSAFENLLLKPTNLTQTIGFGYRGMTSTTFFESIAPSFRFSTGIESANTTSTFDILSGYIDKPTLRIQALSGQYSNTFEITDNSGNIIFNVNDNGSVSTVNSIYAGGGIGASGNINAGGDIGASGNITANYFNASGNFYSYYGYYGQDRIQIYDLSGNYYFEITQQSNLTHLISSEDFKITTARGGSIDVSNLSSPVIINDSGINSSSNLTARHNGYIGFQTYGQTSAYAAITHQYFDDNNSGLHLRYKSNGTTNTGLYLNNAGVISLENGLLFDRDGTTTRMFASSTINYQTNSATLQHRFTNQMGGALTGSLVRIDCAGASLNNINLLGVYNNDQEQPVLNVKSNSSYGGRVGINTLNPLAQLQVVVREPGLKAVRIQLPPGSTSSNDAFSIHDSSGNILPFLSSNDNNLVHLTDHISPKNSFGSKKFYQSRLDNFFVSAANRFQIYYDNIATNDNSLFNGVYDQIPYSIPAGTTRKIRINMIEKNEYPSNQGVVYMEGYLYVSCYYTNILASVSAKWKDRNGNWFNCLPAVNIATNSAYGLYQINTGGGNYGVEFEITLTAPSSEPAHINQIECELHRLIFGDKTANVDKYEPQSLYTAWDWIDVNNTKNITINPNGRIDAKQLYLNGLSLSPTSISNAGGSVQINSDGVVILGSWGNNAIAFNSPINFQGGSTGTTHFNYLNTGANYLRGTVFYIDSHANLTNANPNAPALNIITAVSQTANAFQIQNSSGVTGISINNSCKLIEWKTLDVNERAGLHWFSSGSWSMNLSTVDNGDLAITDNTTNQNIYYERHKFTRQGWYALPNASTVPNGNPTTGGYLYSENGDLKWRNQNGVVQTFGSSGTGAYDHILVVTGIKDGSNKTFTISNAVSTGSQKVFYNGQLLNPGVSEDYVLSGTTLTFQTAHPAPVSTDTIVVYGVY